VPKSDDGDMKAAKAKTEAATTPKPSVRPAGKRKSLDELDVNDDATKGEMTKAAAANTKAATSPGSSTPIDKTTSILDLLDVDGKLMPEKDSSKEASKSASGDAKSAKTSDTAPAKKSAKSKRSALDDLD
jgi:hypothetical protein